MSAADLVAHCRTTRRGVPDGDLRDPRVLAEVLTMLLEQRLEELAGRARGPSGERWDSLSGRLVPTVPAVPAPDPKDDSHACSIATLVGYVEDLAARK